MFYLGNVLLRYVLIYNLEESFNFHLTFVQLCVIKMFIVQWKLFFSLLPAIFFELPITRAFYDFPCRFKLSGVDCTLNIVLENVLALSFFIIRMIPALFLSHYPFYTHSEHVFLNSFPVSSMVRNGWRGGGGGLDHESRVKFLYLHESCCPLK